MKSRSVPTRRGCLLIVAGRQGTIGRFIETVFGAPIVFTPAAAVIATCVASAPFLIRAAQGGFEQVDHLFEDAARTLGRSELSVFITVTIPLAWRSVVAGAALCIARALGEFGATITFVSNIPGETRTLSLAIYAFTQAPGGDAHLWRLVALSIAISFAALLVSEALARRIERRR